MRDHELYATIVAVQGAVDGGDPAARARPPRGVPDPRGGAERGAVGDTGLTDT
jgi:hypothetical protein